MSDDLKPCPFCGGTNLKSGGDDKFVGVWCPDCGCVGPNHYDSGRDWNVRADRIEELEAKLAKAVEYISKDAARIEHVVSKIQFRSGHDSMATQTWVNGWLYEASSIIAGLTGGKDE